MKRITIMSALCITLGMLSSFNVKKVISDEEITVYVYAYTPIKNPNASVFTPVFKMTVPKDNIILYTNVGNKKLEKKLDNYITGELGKELAMPLRLCCAYWSYSLEEAEESRYKEMKNQRAQNNEILHTQAGFYFSYHWQEGH